MYNEEKRMFDATRSVFCELRSDLYEDCDFCIVFPLWFVPVFKLNDSVMFPFYTSVSVYY